MKKKISLGSDHAGFEMKKMLVEWLKGSGYEVSDFGTYSAESVDYPDFAHKVADSVEKDLCDLGIIVCGSGQGVSITANKHQSIRAALCWSPEIAELSRLHNNANVLTLPGRFLTEEEGRSIVSKFLETEFEGGRHQKRIDKIPVR